MESPDIWKNRLENIFRIGPYGLSSKLFWAQAVLVRLLGKKAQGAPIPGAKIVKPASIQGCACRSRFLSFRSKMKAFTINMFRPFSKRTF